MSELMSYLAWGLALSAAVTAGLLVRSERRKSRQLQVSLDAAQSRLDDVQDADALTGLPVRTAFDRELAQAAARVDRSGGALCLLHVGLDGMRLVNETHGHGAGDTVLRETARRLREAGGAGSRLARVGGDEFALLVDGNRSVAHTVADRVLAALARPLPPTAGVAQVTASVGIAAYPDDGAWTRLLSQAALAMLSVKRAGGAARTDFDPAALADARAQAELARDLRLAIGRGELSLVYQPKVDALSLQITAAEALLRWHHPQRGVVSPAVFIPVAEHHGLIEAIGDWVVEEATRQAGAWRQRGLRMRVAINVSAKQLQREDFVDRLADALRRNGLAPSRFTCEITETLAMEDTQATVRAFRRMGQLGLHVSIDDFGTGHSSLASLRRLPAEELKIDRAFVTDLAEREDARSIAEAIIRMGHTLNMRVVAEGVESAAQRDCLMALGCDEMQGYLFARPMPAEVLELWAEDRDGDAPMAFSDSLFQETAPAPLK